MDEHKFNQLVIDVALIKQSLDTFVKTQVETVADHEKRIRSLESFKSKFIGAIIIGNMLTGVIVALIVAYITAGRI